MHTIPRNLVLNPGPPWGDKTGGGSTNFLYQTLGPDPWPKWDKIGGRMVNICIYICTYKIICIHSSDEINDPRAK